MSYPVEEHAKYLADAIRMETYRRALAARVTPGAVVVDLGSGSGILGLLACEAGAGRVYSIDAGSMLDVARKHATSCAFDHRITFLPGHSNEVQLPERADLVVADQMGEIGLWAGLPECFADARRRFLKPTGALLPSKLRIDFTAVDYATLSRQSEAIRANVGALDLSHFQHLLFNDYRAVPADCGRQLTRPASFVTLELGPDEPERFSGTFELQVTESGVATGLAGWFIAELAPGIHLTNAPFAQHRIDRHHLFLPFAQPAPVHQGEILHVSLNVTTRDAFCAWHVQRAEPSGALTTLAKQTSLQGRLLSQDRLERSADAHRPTLNFRGTLQRFVLERCNRENTLASIVDAACECFPEQLRSRTRAVELVVGALRGLAR